MKKRWILLLMLLLMPIAVKAETSCYIDEFGIEQCIEFDPNTGIYNPEEPNIDIDNPYEEPNDNIEEPTVVIPFDNTRLSYLKVVNYGIAFDPDVYEYTIKIPYDINELYILATSYEGVQITGANEVQIDKDKKEIVITTSYGGLEPTIYKIKLKRDYTKFILIIACVTLTIGIILVTIYAIINRNAYLDRMSRDKNRLNIVEQEDAIAASNAVPQQIKVVKSVITTNEVQPTIVKKQIVVNTNSATNFNSIINNNPSATNQQPNEQNINNIQ